MARYLRTFIRWLSLSFAVLCAYFLVLSTAFAQASILPPTVTASLQEADLPIDALGLQVLALDTNQPILSHQAQRPFVPASTQKLITTAAALDMLGKDFVWQTVIYRQGALLSGVLYGDLIIKGSGDPALSHERLSAMLTHIHKKVQHIKGNIIIDNGLFSDVRYDPNAFDGQGQRPYNAYPSAFLVNFGTVETRFLPSGHYEGERFLVSDGQARIDIFPKLEIDYPKSIAISQDCTLPSVKKAHNTLMILGKFGAGCGMQSTWINFGDNEALAVNAVGTQWRMLDKSFTGKVLTTTQTKGTKTPLLIYPSETLQTQIARINQFSNNVMTEQLALSLPVYAAGLPVSSYPKTRQLLEYWFVTTIKKTPPTIKRASGLCNDCSITPEAMIGLLSYMYGQEIFEVYKESLPIAGKSGTMKGLVKRYPNHPAIGQAWIKTGTLNDVTAMAGYVQGQSGRMYGFVAMINHQGVGYQPKAIRVLDELLAWTALQ